MEEYTREQIQRADDTDLYVFLSGRGEQFKRCGKEYRWLRHDSVMINKNEWYRFSQNKGGHAIDFMKEFYGLSFAEAVKELLGEEGVTSMEVVALLKSCAFRFHQTVLVVTHQEEVAQMADRIIRMSDGKICVTNSMDY